MKTTEVHKERMWKRRSRYQVECNLLLHALSQGRYLGPYPCGNGRVRYEVTRPGNGQLITYHTYPRLSEMDRMRHNKSWLS